MELAVHVSRIDSWNLPLFLHVLGAMTLTGVMLVAAISFAAARAGGGTARFGFRTLLVAGIPSYLLMRIGAQVIADKENVPDDATWVTIGYAVTDAGLLFLVIALVCTGIASRRAERGEDARGLVTAGAWLSGLLVAGYAVAVWAMTTKPG